MALSNDPSVLLADEPTGELDSHTAEQIFTAFRTANERLGTTVVIVTHDQAVAGEVRRTVAIRDGRTSTEVLRRSEVDAATVTRPSSPASTPCSTAPDASSCRPSTRRRCACVTASRWNWNPTTSPSARTTAKGGERGGLSPR
ncbi:hypothetical protein GCM10023238_01090 [Streptomyces heliomycini]